MTATARARGHFIRWDDVYELWRYVNDDSVVYSIENGFRDIRPCAHCGIAPDRQGKGHDPCIGHLPDVVSACCGHGVEPCKVKWKHGLVTVGATLSSGLEAYWGEPVPGHRVICLATYQVHLTVEDYGDGWSFWDYSWTCNACGGTHCSNCFYESDGENIYVTDCGRFSEAFSA